MPNTRSTFNSYRINILRINIIYKHGYDEYYKYYAYYTLHKYNFIQQEKTSFSSESQGGLKITQKDSTSVVVTCAIT